jgi:hypothetical protein
MSSTSAFGNGDFSLPFPEAVKSKCASVFGTDTDGAELHSQPHLSQFRSGLAPVSMIGWRRHSILILLA